MNLSVTSSPDVLPASTDQIRAEIILIAGATASGKSSLALSLASEITTAGGQACIINADSMQVYREMQVLTARPSIEEVKQCPHELYGHVSAGDEYNVGRWLSEVQAAIANAKNAGQIPILVGGTGLYFKCLTEGIADIPDIPEDIRKAVRERHEAEGTYACHAALKAIDPQAYQRLEATDPQRVLRALEVYEASGRCLSDWQSDPVIPPITAPMLKILLTPSREWLYARCDSRFEVMIAEGVLEEVSAMAELGLSDTLPAMKALGLKELLALENNEISLEEAQLAAQQATRRYAKRQMTWFRNQMISWNSISEQEYYNKTSYFLSNIIKMLDPV